MSKKSKLNKIPDHEEISPIPPRGETLPPYSEEATNAAITEETAALSAEIDELISYSENFILPDDIVVEALIEYKKKTGTDLDFNLMAGANALHTLSHGWPRMEVNSKYRELAKYGPNTVVKYHSPSFSTAKASFAYDQKRIEKNFRRIDLEINELDATDKSELTFDLIDALLTPALGNQNRIWPSMEHYGMLKDTSRNLIRDMISYYHELHEQLSNMSEALKTSTYSFNEAVIDDLIKYGEKQHWRSGGGDSITPVTYLRILQLRTSLFHALPDRLQSSLTAIKIVGMSDIGGLNDAEVSECSRYLRGAFISFTKGTGSLEVLFTEMYRFKTALEKIVAKAVDDANKLVAIYDSLELSITDVLSASAKRIIAGLPPF